ncbi:MAG: ATP-binding protein [Clostridiales bacterium]|nr:ATP-binding protein [Clostridiales bacterium]
MIKRNDYIQKVKKLIGLDVVKVLVGVRRSGKSTIMQMIIEELKSRRIKDENIVYINYAAFEYEDVPSKRIFEELKAKFAVKGKLYLLLDEIQEVDGWERIVNTFFDGSEYDCEIFVTGSNSRMLSREISTYLTGRYVSIPVFPLSFAEFLEFKKTYTTLGAVKDEFKNYVEFGGFPAVAKTPTDRNEAYTLVKDIYNTTIFTDIVKRSEIRKVDLLERIVKFAFNNVGNTFSANSIAKFFKSDNRTVNIETIYDYLKKLEDAFILYRCSRYDIQGKEILRTLEKFYISDASFKHAVLGYDDTDLTGILENIVYLELCRRGYDVYVGKYNENEIDFVAERQGEKLYIQVAEEIKKQDTKDREYGNLLKIQDNYPKYVLSTGELAGGNHEGIKLMHIADWLLEQ